MALARTLPGPTPKRVPQTVIIRPPGTGQVVTTQVPRPEVSAATPPEACQLPAAKVHVRGPAGPIEICQASWVQKPGALPAAKVHVRGPAGPIEICEASWVQKPGALTAAPAAEVQPPTARITAATHVTQ